MLRSIAHLLVFEKRPQAFDFGFQFGLVALQGFDDVCRPVEAHAAQGFNALHGLFPIGAADALGVRQAGLGFVAAFEGRAVRVRVEPVGRVQAGNLNGCGLHRLTIKHQCLPDLDAVRRRPTSRPVANL
mgnify:CR=1 FL=1